MKLVVKLVVKGGWNCGPNILSLGPIRLLAGNLISLLFSLLEVFTATTLLVECLAKWVNIMFSIEKKLPRKCQPFIYYFTFSFICIEYNVSKALKIEPKVVVKK